MSGPVTLSISPTRSKIYVAESVESKNPVGVTEKSGSMAMIEGDIRLLGNVFVLSY